MYYRVVVSVLKIANVTEVVFYEDVVIMFLVAAL